MPRVQWHYAEGGAQKGPVPVAEVARLVREERITRDTLVWNPLLPEWRPAGVAMPEAFAADAAADDWYHAQGGTPQGPVGRDRILALAAEGNLGVDSLVWRPGWPEWRSIGQVASLLDAPELRARGVLGRVGAGLSHLAGAPTLSDVPIGGVLVGGLGEAADLRGLSVEDELAVGTRRTTPPLSQVEAGWPRARLFWRLLAGSLTTYVLLRFGLLHFQNANFFPGVVVVGSFVVPLSVVVLFFEMNTPRNVSVYVVAKLVLLGGALSLVAAMAVFGLIPAAGAGALVPALLTGVCEETGKALPLLLVAFSPRYPWQLNGILFGAAIGAGFAGFESAGYAFAVALERKAVEPALAVVFLRGILSPGSHVIWTALVASALWKAKAGGRSLLAALASGVVLRRWLIAVVLHGLWDTDLPLVPVTVKLVLLGGLGWYLVFAVLKQALAEVDEARRRLASSRPGRSA